MKARISLRLFLLLAVLLIVFSHQSSAAQEISVAISEPTGGTALQGVVTINGATAVEGFRAAEVAFAYQSDSTGTWFLIQQSVEPVTAGWLASWDTTTISDGDYRLRLQVFLQDGQVLVAEVNGLRVRNYSPVETSTPAPLTTGPARATPVPPTSTPLADFIPQAGSATPLPTNPAVLSREQLQQSALQGAGVVVAALLFAGLYLGARALIRR